MNFRFNLITLALLSISGSSIAADFSVLKANTQSVDTRQYRCNNCGQPQPLTGEISLSSGWNNSPDMHAGNAFGKDRDGWMGAVSGNVNYQGTDGYRTELNADNLGLDSSRAHISTGKDGVFRASMDYSLLTHYQAQAQSPIWYSNELLQPSEQQQRYPRLFMQRENIGASFALQLDDYRAFLDVNHSTQVGNKAASLIAADGVINFANPVDSHTDSVNAGISGQGNTWFSTLQYNGSFFRNDIGDLSLPYSENVYAATPDNDAHQLSLEGQYQLANSVFTGRIAAGRMIQDGELIPMEGNPLNRWDGQVDTRDVRVGMSTLLSPKWRLNGQYSYSDRDNQSSIADFAQLEWDTATGSFKANLPLDVNRQGIKLQSSYRFSRGWRLSGEYEHKQTERNYLEREENREDNGFVKVHLQPFDTLQLGLKAIYQQRDGSRYDASRITAPQENPLLRKYYLADRQQYGSELTIHHAPWSWMSVDLSARYAKDDYQHSDLGLTAADEYRYDANLSVDPLRQLHLYATASQQWINSDMAGSSNYSTANWLGCIEDRFINLGAGASYRWSEQLSLGADYLFANSESNRAIDNSDYGDYYDFSHSLTLFGNYAMTERLGLKLSYRYERYYDTDDAQVEVDAITGLTTLGKLDHNYNAHLLMLTVSYRLP